MFFHWQNDDSGFGGYKSAVCISICDALAPDFYIHVLLIFRLWVGLCHSRKLLYICIYTLYTHTLVEGKQSGTQQL